MTSIKSRGKIWCAQVTMDHVQNNDNIGRSSMLLGAINSGVCVWTENLWICKKCAQNFSGEIILVIVTGEKWMWKKWIGINGTWRFTIEIDENIGVDAWLWFDSFMCFCSWQRLAAHTTLLSFFFVSDFAFVAHNRSKTKTIDENYMRITNDNDTRCNLCTLRAVEPFAIR